MDLINWINGVTKLNKTTMDTFQNNIKDEFDNVHDEIGQVDTILGQVLGEEI